MDKHEYTVVLTMDNIYATDPVEAAELARKMMRDALMRGQDPVFDVYRGELEPGAGTNHTRLHGDTDSMCRTDDCPELYSEGDGDGYDGFCASCADKLSVLEDNGVEIDGREVSDYDRISVDLATLDELHAAV